MSKTLIPVSREEGKILGYMFNCPGCGGSHVIATSPDYFADKAVWQFNGDTKKPTFTPSLHNSWDFEGQIPKKICHLNITNGQIVFHGDSTHSLAGQTVNMIPIEIV